MRKHVTQFASNVALEKCVENWIHRSIGNQDKVDDEPQGTSEGAEVGEETDAPVVSSEVSDVKGRHDQHNQQSCSSGV